MLQFASRVAVRFLQFASSLQAYSLQFCFLVAVGFLVCLRPFICLAARFALAVCSIWLNVVQYSITHGLVTPT